MTVLYPIAKILFYSCNCVSENFPTSFNNSFFHNVSTVRCSSLNLCNAPTKKLLPSYRTSSFSPSITIFFIQITYYCTKIMFLLECYLQVSEFISSHYLSSLQFTCFLLFKEYFLTEKIRPTITEEHYDTDTFEIIIILFIFSVL